jgi:hypothetical protein
MRKRCWGLLGKIVFMVLNWYPLHRLTPLYENISTEQLDTYKVLLKKNLETIKNLQREKKNDEDLRQSRVLHNPLSARMIGVLNK